MTLDAFLFQILDGLAGASSLFLVAAGLSIIFGVSRIVNMAHGSFYMLGIYIAYSFAAGIGGALGFWGGIAAAALLVAGIGALIEVLLLRRIYRSPQLFQLLATFAVLLIVNDAALWIWGPEDLLGPRAPGLSGAIEIFGRRLPAYNLFLILAGPAILIALHLVLQKTRWGRLIRAATQDREMVGALGVNQALLFTGVFALGAGLAGLGGALQVAREPATLSLDLAIIGDAFVVVVVGGLGSVAGAYLAALIIAEVKALLIGVGHVEVAGAAFNLSKLTLVAEFLVMALVLIVRPYGLLGRPQGAVRGVIETEDPLRPAGALAKAAAVVLVLGLALLPLFGLASPYLIVLGTDALVAALFAASLHFIMGPGGLHSFGHAAAFGLGAYGAALLFPKAGLPSAAAMILAPFAALVGALLIGWFAVRLSGVYFAMLTLAFAQIVWSIVFQWEDVTGGSNGIFGIWPGPPLNDRSAYYLFVLGLTVLAVLALRRALFAPFGLALRASRDSPVRAEAIGLDTRRIQWTAFAIAGFAGGLAGALFAFSKGSISPETISVGRSIDALVMVLLGGVNALSGPLVGGPAFTILQDTVIRETAFWRAALGAIILLLVLLFPEGIVGTSSRWISMLAARARKNRASEAAAAQVPALGESQGGRPSLSIFDPLPALPLSEGGAPRAGAFSPPETGRTKEGAGTDPDGKTTGSAP